MGSLVWKFLLAGVVTASTVLANKAVTTIWQAATGEDPPINPDDPDVEWKQAVGWALLSGAAIGLAKLFATRQAAAYYAKSSGGTLPTAITRRRSTP